MTQLELFDGAGAPVASPRIAQNGAETAAQDVPGVQAPSKAGGRAGAALAPAGVPIPARCPVTGGRTCHRAACRYYRSEADGLCAHPEARTAGPPAAFETGPLSAAAVSRTWTARVIAAWRIVAGAATAWTGRARRPRRRRGAGEHILMHRLLHHDRAGGWTWRVRGAQVPAARTTDVCLVIDPAADSHYCPDCLLGAVPLWDATAGNHPRVAKCRDCGSVFVLVFVHRRRAARAAMS